MNVCGAAYLDMVNNDANDLDSAVPVIMAGRLHTRGDLL